ncbi:prostatic spermine-binding protein-like [Notamacropus eugenii]|uniref:prostatic spermine-binding protein-like n=1 Tax=Notamacropus eugenii TaxID=9315 RepID=UPI003B67DED0
MQSFLVLVLLGGIVCSLHGVLSEELSGTGTLFSISGQYFGDTVRAIKFFFGPLGFLRGIQAKIGDEWSPRYGVSGGSESRIILYDGESIIRVSGQGKVCIRFIEMETNTGRIFRAGKPIGNYFDKYPPYEDMELSGIRGLYGITCIKKLEFDWSYSPEMFAVTEIVDTTDIPVQSSG